ncbi:hypothetical protein [Capybara microvirus Cap1_SP_108]|nr:hypothetical protein [Capybara microvirus Cap1_SP_108]
MSYTPSVPLVKPLSYKYSVSDDLFNEAHQYFEFCSKFLNDIRSSLHRFEVFAKRNERFYGSFSSAPIYSAMHEINSLMCDINRLAEFSEAMLKKEV